MLGDLLDAAHNLTTGGAGRSATLRRVEITPIDDLQSAYYLTLQVADRLLASCARRVRRPLGNHRVSIRLMEQEGIPSGGGSGGSRGGSGGVTVRGLAGDPGAPAPLPSGRRPGESGARLVFITHPAYERDVQACLHDLRQLDVVERIGGLLRVVGP